MVISVVPLLNVFFSVRISASVFTHLQHYLTYGFSDETAHHQALGVDEEVGLGLCGSAQSHLLETQLVVRHTPHVLGLTPKTHSVRKKAWKSARVAPFLSRNIQYDILYDTHTPRNKLKRKPHTFLMAYLGSSGMTRRIFPSQNSATTRSFFQPWKHNREEKLQLKPTTQNKLTSPWNKLLPAALAEDLCKVPNYFK